MRSPEGWFYYQRWRFWTNRINYMRWSQACMLLALAEFATKLRLAQPVADHSSRITGPRTTDNGPLITHHSSLRTCPMPESPEPAVKRQRLLGGLLVRRERWSLSCAGRLLVAILFVAATYGFMRSVHPFLVVNNGGAGEVMVVEGWIGSRPIDQAARAFKTGHYQYVVVVRGIYEGGDKWTSGRYSADYVAAALVEHGVPKELVHTLFEPVVHKDRTYHCAVAVRQWLEERGTAVRSLDVVTVACHARRSRLLYEKAFGRSVEIGAVALPDPTYDSSHWWRTSEGVRDVLGEAIAYGYVRVFFWPGAGADDIAKR